MRRDATFPLPPRPLRTVRMRVGEVLSGVEPGQWEIEIATGQGGGDCGYPFEVGADYVVYAHKNGDGKLEATSCSRTRPLAQAEEDLQYIRSNANAPATGHLSVQTGYPGLPGKRDVTIAAEGGGLRHLSRTDPAGVARFPDLPAGEYTIHAEADGDLPDDPKVQLGARGCREVTLFRALRIAGRVTTKSGEPAARIHLQYGSVGQTIGWGGAMTDPDGRYELRIVRPGQYYLWIDLDQSGTQQGPRWFYPGAGDQASATVIEFSGKPETRTYDLTLPDRKP